MEPITRQEIFLANAAGESTQDLKPVTRLEYFLKNVADHVKSIGNGGTGGGTSIDVTAQVGQTIVVKEVDANGKPTAWESADYQQRTHGTVIEELLPNTVATFMEEDGFFAIECDFAFISGRTYTINWNGTPYVCVAFDADGVAVGNLDLLLGTGDTGEPFYIGAMDGMMNIMPLDGSAEVTVGVIGEVFQKIDKAYLPNDILYGNTTGCTSGVFDFGEWCWHELLYSSIFNTTYKLGASEVWEDTPITKEQFEMLNEIFANQIIYINTHGEFTRAGKAGDDWQIQWKNLSKAREVVSAESYTLHLKWDDASGCVQRSCQLHDVRIQTISAT